MERQSQIDRKPKGPHNTGLGARETFIPREGMDRAFGPVVTKYRLRLWRYLRTPVPIADIYYLDTNDLQCLTGLITYQHTTHLSILLAITFKVFDLGP